MEGRTVVELSVDKVKFVNDGRERQKATVYLQNRCHHSKKLRATVSSSSDPSFKLISGYDEHMVAGGLKLPLVLQYTPRNCNAHHGEINVLMEDKIVHCLPIEALPPSAVLQVSTHAVDFGSLVGEHQVVCKSFLLTNTGSMEGSFVLVCDSLPEQLRVVPMEGRLNPGRSVEIKLELLCKVKGSFKEVLSICSEHASAETHAVTVSGVIQSRKLELMDSELSAPLQCVAFGSTYYGTVLTKKVVLYNNSPALTEFIAIFDEKALGTIQGADMSESLAMACTAGGLGQTKWKEQGNAPPTDTIVQVMPAQGTLSPFETKTLDFVFSPEFCKADVGWSHHQGLSAQRDYALFIKFIYVGVHSKYTEEKTTDVIPEPLEVTFTGTALPVELTLQPGNVLDFENCIVDCCSCKEFHLCNDSASLPLEFCCHQQAHYKCSPMRGKVNPGEKFTLTVLFQPRQLGCLDSSLVIDVLGPYVLPQQKDKNKIVVHTETVELKGTGISKRIEHSPSKKIAMAQVNDLATSIRPHDTRKMIRTPFTGKFRYGYLDPDYMFSRGEALSVKKHKEAYLRLIKQWRSDRLWRQRDKVHGNPAYHNEKDIGISPAQGLCPPQPNLKGAISGGAALLSKTSRPAPGLGSGSRLHTTTDVVTKTSHQIALVEVCPNKPQTAEAATQCKALLTSEQLCQIVIDPVVVNFGSVVVNSTAERTISIKNYLSESFSIKIEMSYPEIGCPQYPTCSGRPFITLALPPLSFTQLLFTFRQDRVGTFERFFFLYIAISVTSINFSLRQIFD